MPVQFNVAQLLQAEIGSIRHHEVDLPAHRIDDSVELVAPLIGKLKLTRTNRGILADADFSTELRFDCSRCLTDVVVPIHTRFTEEYYPTVDLRSGLQAAVPEGGSGYMLSESHELDLTEPTRQAILLENPMKPLCRADCLGSASTAATTSTVAPASVRHSQPTGVWANWPSGSSPTDYTDTTSETRRTRCHPFQSVNTPRRARASGASTLASIPSTRPSAPTATAPAYRTTSAPTAVTTAAAR